MNVQKSEKLSERRIIEIIQDFLELMPRMPIPFGDDVSACELTNGYLAVLKTDMLVDKTDVPPGMSLWQAARKAVVMNISDFAAKGVAPKALMVSLGLPRGLSEKDVEKIGKGLNAGAREYDTYIIGGDTGEASDLVVSVSLFGIAKKGEVMLRSGARPGDIVAVTGFFGKPSAGLRILLNDLEASTDIRKVLVKSVLMPKARLKEGLVLGKTKAVTASIDSSDGLAWSLHEIARASNVGFRIDKLPIAPEAEAFAEIFDMDIVELSLYGGEEYELIVTINPRLWKSTERAVANAKGELFPIGKVTAEKDVLLELGGKECRIEPRGYEHFRT